MGEKQLFFYDLTNKHIKFIYQGIRKVKFRKLPPIFVLTSFFLFLKKRLQFGRGIKQIIPYFCIKYIYKQMNRAMTNSLTHTGMIMNNLIAI